MLITGRNPAKLADTKRRLPQVHTFQSDVSDSATIRQLAEQVIGRFSALNVLINKAGKMRKLLLQDPATDLLDLTRESTPTWRGRCAWCSSFCLSSALSQLPPFSMSLPGRW